MADDVQVVTSDAALSDNSKAVQEKAVGLVHIIDPQCRNLKFGSSAGDPSRWIVLTQILPSDLPPDAPDSIKMQYPGEAFVDPDHPELGAFREHHGNHATIRDLAVKPTKVKDESVQKPKK